MSITNVVITTVDTAAMVLDQLDPQGASSSTDSLQRLARYIDGLADGAFYYTTVVEEIGAVQAVGTLTVTSTGPTNGETGTVANQTITAETTGADPTMGQFNISATASVVATNIALAINSTPAISAVVHATHLNGVVTIIANDAGASGNGIELDAGNLANTAASGFASGTNGTKVTLS